jgi:hypothetical protein
MFRDIDAHQSDVGNGAFGHRSSASHLTFWNFRISLFESELRKSGWMPDQMMTACVRFGGMGGGMVASHAFLPYLNSTRKEQAMNTLPRTSVLSRVYKAHYGS